MAPKNYKWNIDKESITDDGWTKMQPEYQAARTQMKQRTHHHELYGLIAKNKSIHEWTTRRGKSKYFSEGSTQYILRKTLADTIQRMPDGELNTPYDLDSKENIWLQYLFENKVMWSEYEGIDMLSNITNCYKYSFIYGFAPVRTGFEKDYDDDIRVSFNLETWTDVFVNADCKDVRRPDVVYHRQYMSKAEVENLLDEDGNVLDPTYSEDTIKYILDHNMFGSKQWESERLGDQLKASTSVASLELLTEYRRGSDEFVTYVPSANAVFRTVKNYDPRKGIPWTFLVLEPDPDFPLGVSQVEFLLADQQFNDLFQTSAYKNLLLAMEPPIMVSGWETNPSSYKFKPRSIWNLGNNPNQVKVEQVKIDNSVLGNWSNTREAIAASMLRNLNVADGTIAKDSGTTYSKTAPGVNAQQEAKTININQYQKRVEYFIAEWANMALRCYVNSMSGEHEVVVDEETRRHLLDIGEFIDPSDTHVTIDFSLLKADSLEYRIRAGSLVQRKEDQEREALAEMIQPFVQNLNGWSEENRKVVENEVLLPVMMRMLELSDTDVSHSTAQAIQKQIMESVLADVQEQLQSQQMQLIDQQAQMNQMQDSMLAEQGLPGSPPAESPEMGVAPQAPNGIGMPPTSSIPVAEGGGTSPSSAAPPDITAGQQMNLEDQLMNI